MFIIYWFLLTFVNEIHLNKFKSNNYSFKVVFINKSKCQCCVNAAGVSTQQQQSCCCVLNNSEICNVAGYRFEGGVKCLVYVAATSEAGIKSLLHLIVLKICCIKVQNKCLKEYNKY